MPKGPQPKHPDKRQRRNTPKLVVVESLHPSAPDGLLPETEAGWDDYWGSDVARAVSVEDLPALIRLFRLRDEWERARIMIASSGEVVPGSMGQSVLNPLYRRLDAAGGEIRQLEDRFGANPMSRARLAVSMGELHRTIDDLSRGLREGTSDDSDPLQIVDVSDTDA